MAAKAGGKLTLEAVRDFVAQRVSKSNFESMFKQMKVVSANEGKCCCELKVQPAMLNASGTLHGGVTASLVDAVSTYALTTTGQGRTGSSIELSVSYLKPVKEGEDIIVSANTLRCGQSIAVCTVDVINKGSGQLIAHGKHSKYFGAASVPNKDVTS